MCDIQQRFLYTTYFTIDKYFVYSRKSYAKLEMKWPEALTIRLPRVAKYSKTAYFERNFATETNVIARLTPIYE